MNDDAKDRADLIRELEQLRVRLRATENALAERDACDFELAKSRALLENISDLAYLCDDKGNILYVNHVFEKLSGHSAADFIGKPFDVLFSEKELKIATDAYLRTLKGESPVYELSFVRTGRLCEYRNHPFRDTDGMIIGVLGTARDITEKKKAFEQLEKNGYLLRESQRVACLGSYVLDFDSGLWTGSEVLYEIFGLDDDRKLDFGVWVSLMHPEHREQMVDYLRDHVAGGHNPFDREYRIIRLKDGVERWVHGLGKLVFDSNGKLVEMIGTIQDVTEKKKAEEMTRASEERFRSLFDSMMNGFGLHEIVCSSDGTPCDYRFLEVNHAFEELTGFHRENVVGRTVVEVMPGIEPYWIESYGKVALTGKPARFENYSGVLGRYYEVVAYSPRKGQFATVFADITERKRMENELRKANDDLELRVEERTAELKKSETILAEAQRVAKMGSMTWDMDKSHPLVSDEFLRIFELSRRDFEKDPGIVIRERMHPDDRERVEQHRDSTLAAKKPGYACDYRVLLAGGTVKDIHSEGRITYDRDGKPSTIIGTVQDVTEKKQAEREKERFQAKLLHSQKMEAIGIMAGGIAHDFNNIMTVVNSLTDLMLQKTRPDDPFFKYLHPISDSCRRAVNLVQQLLLFSNRKPKKISNFNLNEAVSELRGFFEHLLSEDIIVDMDLKHGLWEIDADRGRIEQVLTNLVLNSSDAMPHGGTVTVRTKNVEVGEDRCAGAPGAFPGRFVCLTVEDTGTGIDPEVQKHIFEPFFTTKKAKNSGMGLAVVYGVVKDHNGWVSVESEPGAGAVFKVFLPAASAAEAPDSQCLSKTVKNGGGRRILLVEDERLVRNSTALVLEENGYVVFEASNAESAIKLFIRENGEFDLVLSDVVMPGLSGLQMTASLMDINPSVPVLLCSGYLDEKSQISEIIRRRVAFLQKPYDVSELLCAVEETIRQHKTTPEIQS